MRNLILVLFFFLIFPVYHIFSQEKENQKSNFTSNKVQDIEKEKKSYEEFPKSVLTNPILERREYIENDFRRADIIFFLSTPIFFIYQLFLNEIIVFSSDIKGYTGLNYSFLNFTTLQWAYIISSSILGGILVALGNFFEDKNINPYYFQFKRLSSSLNQEISHIESYLHPINRSPVTFNFSYTFYF